MYADTWVDPDDDPRERGDATEGELATLLGYLTDYRLTLQMKV